jgi:hypothetical protein
MREPEARFFDSFLGDSLKRLKIVLIEVLDTLRRAFYQCRHRGGVLAAVSHLSAIENLRINRDPVGLGGPQPWLRLDERLLFDQRGLSLYRINGSVGNRIPAPALLEIGSLPDAFKQSCFKQAVVPHAVKFSRAVARATAFARKLNIDQITTSIIRKRDMKRLMQVANPMTDRHEGKHAVLIGCLFILQDIQVTFDPDKDAAAFFGAVLAFDRFGVTADVDEVIVRVLARLFVFFQATDIERCVVAGC